MNTGQSLAGRETPSLSTSQLRITASDETNTVCGMGMRSEEGGNCMVDRSYY